MRRGFFMAGGARLAALEFAKGALRVDGSDSCVFQIGLCPLKLLFSASEGPAGGVRFLLGCSDSVGVGLLDADDRWLGWLIDYALLGLAVLLLILTVSYGSSDNDPAKCSNNPADNGVVVDLIADHGPCYTAHDAAISGTPFGRRWSVVSIVVGLVDVLSVSERWHE